MESESQALANAWKYVYGFTNASIVVCAVELEIPDVVQKHDGGPISLADLSSAVGCQPGALYRVMRFLIHHGIFKKVLVDDGAAPSVCYAQSPLSSLLTRDRLGSYVLLQGSGSRPHGCLTVDILKNGKSGGVYDEEPSGGSNTFTDAMECHAREVIKAMIGNYPEGFRGIGSLVDVGGRHGLALKMLVEAFPWVRGINFDLPVVVAGAPALDGIEFVGGDMFEHVPKADAVMLMWVLHNWSDETSIDILKKCKDAVPTDTGKVMIIDAVVCEDEEEDEFTGTHLSLDIVMLTVTETGKERTYAEWVHLLNAAGFSKHTIKNIKSDVSVIEAYP